jgi:Domain of unknown function (DUF222)
MQEACSKMSWPS